MADQEKAPKRQHKATFASDKRKPGSYLIRVAGPHASAFAGRDVPVTRKDNSESTETLAAVVWAGIDDESGDPVALYRFVAKPREEDTADDLPF
jgi:hypothetical protein